MSKEQTIENIAKSIAGIETLKTRNADDLDFNEVSVWELKRVLEEAFEAGRKSAR